MQASEKTYRTDRSAWLRKLVAAMAALGFGIAVTQQALAVSIPLFDGYGVVFTDVSNANPRLVDIDGDGDFDLFVGANDGSVRFFKNVGTTQNGDPKFEEKTDAENPLDIVDAVVTTFATLEFGNLDGDSDLDAFIGAGDGTVHYFKNIGSAAAPTFEYAPAENPLSGVAKPSDTAPALGDYDNDNDIDALVGHQFSSDGTRGDFQDGDISYFAPPAYSEDEPSNPAAGIGSNTLIYLAPSFAQIDSDSDLELFVGAEDGLIRYYDLSGISYTEQLGGSNPFDGIDVGYYSAPTFADLDTDGDLDAMVGDHMGAVHLLWNSGNTTNPFFAADNPLLGVKKFEVKPALVDIDGDGDLDAFFGESPPQGVAGGVYYFENTGSGQFDPNASNPLTAFLAGTNASTAPAFVDIDGDGDQDAFVSTSGGTLYFMRNSDNTNDGTNPTFDGANPQTNPIFGLPSSLLSATALHFFRWDDTGPYHLLVGTSSGSFRFFQNGSLPNQDPLFTELVGASNPFDGLTQVVSNSAPAMFDFDNDGDLDLISGAGNGLVYYFENTNNSGDDSIKSFAAAGEQGSNGLTAKPNPFAHVRLTSHSAPAVGNIAGSAEADVLFGRDTHGAILLERVADTENPVVSAPPAKTFIVQTAQAPTENDLGIATVSDNASFNLVAAPTDPGPYLVSTAIVWEAFDDAGNRGTDTQEITVVIDDIPPLVTTAGHKKIEATGPVTTPLLSDLGQATATDANPSPAPDNTPVPLNLSGKNVGGPYSVTWSVFDIAGNEGTAEQTFEIVDSTPPVISLTNGPSSSTPDFSIVKGATFTEPGATAVDLVDGSIAPIVEGSVNVNVVDTYALKYTATDSSGNSTSRTRTVTVTEAPSGGGGGDGDGGGGGGALHWLLGILLPAAIRRYRMR